VDIRGFGNFTVRHRTTKTGRNPKTSEAVYLSERRMPMFKAGKDISAKINKSY
jgi:integration host factor subunit beta